VGGNGGQYRRYRQRRVMHETMEEEK